MFYKSKLIKGFRGWLLLFSASLFSHSIGATKLNIVTEHLALQVINMLLKRTHGPCLLIELN